MKGHNYLLWSVMIVLGLSCILPSRVQAADIMSSINALTDSIASFFSSDDEVPKAYGESENLTAEERLNPQEETVKFHPRDLEVTIINQKDEKFRFDVELALNPQEHAQGLMNRGSLEETRGMLFVFHSSEKRNFWMKDTLIPLDVIFIREDGTIDHIHSMAKPLDRTMVTSGRESYAVLEINGGLSDKLGIQKGDVIYHPIFRNLNRLEN